MANSIAINIGVNGVPSLKSAFQSVGNEALSLRGKLSGLAGISFNSLEGKLSRLDAQLEGIGKQRFEGVRTTLESIDNVGNSIMGLGLKVGGALALAGGYALKTAASVESIGVGFKTFLGSADAATAKLKEIREFANVSPFNFTESAKSAQKLLAVGFSSQELIPIMKSVGDAVSAAGGDTETFTGVLTALGQIKTNGKASKEDLNQIAERGIPVFKILKDELGLTSEQVANIGEQGIASEKVIAALMKGFDRKFGGAMGAQAETLGGQFSTLQDSVEGLASAVGDVLAPEAKEFVANMTELVNSATEWVKANPEAVKGFVNIAKYVGLSGIAVIGLTKGFSLLGKSIVGISGAASTFKNLTGVITGTTAAKKGLEAITKADTVAELAKGKAADIEGASIGKVGKEATETGKKLGMLARVKGFLGSPAGGLKMLGGAPVTAGGAALSAGLGLAAGYGASDDYKSLGLSNSQANVAGIVTGIGAGLVSLFVPGGAIAVAAGTGIRYAFNELYNRPLERAAEAGTGLSDEQIAVMKDKSPQERADEYFKLRDKALAEGDETGAAINLRAAQTELRRGKRLEAEKKKKEQDAEIQKLNNSENTEYKAYLRSRGITPDDGSISIDARKNKGVGSLPSQVQVRGTRDGSGVIRLEGSIPISPQERDARSWANRH